MPETAPRNIAALHPAFIVSPKRVDAAIKRGQQLSRAGITYGDLRKMNSQLPRGVRGERGKSHESYVGFLSLDAYPIVWDAYSAASRYESLVLPAPLMNGGMYVDCLYFTVSLVSVPRNQEPSEEDVKVTKFVLTDDLGNIFQPLDPQLPAVAIRATMTISGNDETTTTNTAQSYVDTTTYSTDSNGKQTKHDTSGTVTTFNYQTEYHPWTREAPYYYAGYQVRFPLFKPDGQPTVTTRTKKLTLHMITEAGERIAEFKLESPKE